MNYIKISRGWPSLYLTACNNPLPLHVKVLQNKTQLLFHSLKLHGSRYLAEAVNVRMNTYLGPTE